MLTALKTDQDFPEKQIFREYQKKFNIALSDEIKAMKKSGGQMINITDGRRLRRRKNGYYTYSFTCDSEILFPDDTPIILVYQKQENDGVLLSIEGSDLIIAIKKDIGEKVNNAKMKTEPWFLLEELQQRLEAAVFSEKANKKLALSLLSFNEKSLPENSECFEDFKGRIESQTGSILTYNEYQAKAITHVLQHPISFIWGPPGTGKTSTLGLTVASLVHSGKSVLILSHSNTAVDNAMRSLAKHLCHSSYYNEGMILRFGVDTLGVYKDYPMINVRGVAKKQNPQLIEQIIKLEKERRQKVLDSRRSNLSQEQKDLIDKQLTEIKSKLQPLKQKLKQIESGLVEKAEVIGCTLSKASIAKEIYKRKFDAVIIDEGSMVYIPHCAYAATLANRRVAVFGDFRQLGPISQAKTESAQEWLQRDIFDEAGIITKVNRNKDDDRMVLLQTQYRMHPRISEIPNQLFYNNRLEDGEGIELKTQNIVEALPHQGNPLVFYDISQVSAFCFRENESNSRFNIVSALIAASLSYRALQEQSGTVAIITPYSAQSRLLNRILKETHVDEGFSDRIKASTVHKFQGSEKSLIIFDAVDSYPQKKDSLLLRGGQQSTAARLSNVAISRAQGKFIGIFNYDFIKERQDPFSIFRKFTERLRSKSLIYPFELDSSNGTSHQELVLGVALYDSCESARCDIENDIKSAKNQIAVDWSTIFNPRQYFDFRSKKEGIHCVLSGEGTQSIIKLIGKYNTYQYKADSFSSMGIVGIDEKTLWIYTNLRSSKCLILKISLPKTVDLLYSFLRLTPSGTGIIDFKKSSEEKTSAKKTDKPFGCCELCNSPLWPQPDGYGYFTNSCPKHPRQTRRITCDDATRYAQLNKKVCGDCNSSLKGVKNKSTGKVFMACTNNKCQWKCDLRNII
ncbi:AAA family ATPase [Synechocystis salina LEGE 06155]|nr:AAA family ATPase [Synechocystis salina LEGE 06155]